MQKNYDNTFELPQDDTISVEEIKDLMSKVENFYEERENPRVNIIWLANIILKRLNLDRDYFINIEGVTGCLDEDTEVITKDGKIKIKDLKNKINELLVYDFNNNKTLFSESLLVDSGKKEVSQILTYYHKEIIATYNHTFFRKTTYDVEEIKLRDLKDGDELLCSKIDGTTFFDKIKSIKKIGIKQTYDFKVPVYNNFILGNNIITHNSGKSNLILLLSLIQCRYSGIWQNKITGKKVRVLPRIKPLPKEWEQLTFGFQFNKNMSFLDEVEQVKNKFHGLDRYHPFIIDEGSKNLHKYQWNNKLQFILVQMSATERWQNKSVYVCFPNFKELNAAFRNDRILMRLYLYDRDKAKGFARCIMSLRDYNRYVTDPWHTEDNSKSYEEILKRLPIAVRGPKDILYAEKKLKNYAGNFDVPSLERMAPRIWDLYMKYKTYYANKDADKLSSEDEDEGRREKKLKSNIKRLLEYLKQVNPELKNKDLQRISGLSTPMLLKILSAEDNKGVTVTGRF